MANIHRNYDALWATINASVIGGAKQWLKDQNHLNLTPGEMLNLLHGGHHVISRTDQKITKTYI